MYVFDACAGDKYPGSVLATIRPARGVSLEAAEASLMTELARLSSDGLTPSELQRIKKVGSGANNCIAAEFRRCV